MWRFREGLPDYVQKAILHGIDGLDPHRPVFDPNKCYHWKWDNCVMTQKDMFHVRIPYQKKGLRSLMWYHFSGRELPAVETSSRSLCPHHPDQKYGSCCFPKVYMRCHRITGYKDRGLCMNPHHMVAGTERESRLEMENEGCLLSWDPAVAEQQPLPCETCQWSPSM